MRHGQHLHQPDRRLTSGPSGPLGRLRRLRDDEDGSVVTAPIALVIFLLFLMMAVQVATHLYAISTTTSIVFDVTRRVAASAGTGSSYLCDDARADVQGRLGGWGSGLGLECRGDGQHPMDGGQVQDYITFRVVGDSPARLVAGLGELTGFATFEREVRVRTEQFQ